MGGREEDADQLEGGSLEALKGSSSARTPIQSSAASFLSHLALRVAAAMVWAFFRGSWLATAGGEQAEQLGGFLGDARDGTASSPSPSRAARPDKSGKGCPDMPLQVLRLLGRYLDPEDMAAARLACAEWREQLSAQVAVLGLPPLLWQYCEPGQVASLYRLLDSFRHVRCVKLRLAGSQPLDSWAVARAADTLRLALPMLRELEVCGVMQAGHWRAVLVSVQCLAPQLSALRLSDMCWPPLDALHLMTGFSGLTSLAISSPHFSRLEAEHLAAIGRLTALQELRLSFRTVTGTAAAPLSLDPLSALTRLSELDVQYSGLLELSSAVVFCRPAALAALTALRSLVVGLIPTPSLAAISRLPALRSLVLQQAQPLTGLQCCALARCRQLSSLAVSCVQFTDVAHLAPLTGLTSLSLQVWQPSRGSLPGSAAGQQLLALRHLAGLRHLHLRGQCELPSDLLGRLAAHWPGLTSLDLCCVLPDGTQGLQFFSELRSLSVRPYKWDVWSSEPPVLLYPSLLPPSLTALQALDVWCMEQPLPPRGADSGPGGAGGLHRSSSYCSITGFVTGMTSSVARELCNLGSNVATAAAAAAGQMAGDAAGAAAAAAAATTSSAPTTIDEDASCGTGACSEHGGDDDGDASAGSGSSSSSCYEDALDDSSGSGSLAVLRACASAPAALQQAAPPQQPHQQPQHQGVGGLVLNTPRLRRLVLRSTSPFDVKLLMPAFDLCSQLEHLELQHSQLNQCHVRHIAAACPGRLRALKLVAADDGARIRASGLTILTQLSALTSLSVHAHERAMNRNVRRAIASMGQLRTLTLLTSPDHPSAFARSLACLTQLTNLAVLRVGLGFGTLDALRRLGSHVGKALPHCTYQMLTDGCCD